MQFVLGEPYSYAIDLPQCAPTRSSRILEVFPIQRRV